MKALFFVLLLATAGLGLYLTGMVGDTWKETRETVVERNPDGIVQVVPFTARKTGIEARQ